MQIERYLFRVAQRINTSSKAQTCWKIIYYAALIVFIYAFTLLLIGQFHLKPTQNHLSSCFISHNFTLKADEFALIYSQRSQQLMKQIKKFPQTYINNLCQIYKNINDTNITEINQIELYGQFSIFEMQNKQRQQLKFDNYTIILKNRSFFKDVLYGIPVLIVNQLVRIIDNNQYRNIVDSEIVYFKYKYTKFNHTTFMRDNDNFTTKLVGVMQTLFTFVVAQVITHLYIYVTIISTPVLILIVISLCSMREQQHLHAFNSFPWIKMHSLIFLSSSNEAVQEASISHQGSLLLYFIIMYLFYLSTTYELSKLLDSKSIQIIVNEYLFGYFAMIQYLSLLFMRTKLFLKFFPIINSIGIIYYMLYCQFNSFGFLSIAGTTMNSFGLCLFSWMMIHFQLNALNNHNNNNQIFIPNIKQPRAGLLSVFNFNWISNLPDQWTMLIPLSTKQKFNEKQLTFINEQYQQLNQYLIQN